MKAAFAIVSSMAWLVLVGSGSLATVSILVLGMGYRFQGSLIYFPGDPPYLDVALHPAAAAFVLCGVLFVLRTWLSNRLRFSPTFYGFLLAVLIASSFSSAVSAGGVLFRFSQSWAPVRHGIGRYGEAILAASGGDRTRTLSREEFLRLQQQFLPAPVEVQLSGFGAVQLRMNHGVYPYVGVDFGSGRNALFDPDTMLCTYSD